jgi:hypothetical protein
MKREFELWCHCRGLKWCEVKMNTMFLLMAEYGSATVPLSQVCEKYFGLKSATAEKRAAMGDLPIQPSAQQRAKRPLA